MAGCERDWMREGGEERGQSERVEGGRRMVRVGKREKNEGRERRRINKTS